MEHPTTQESAEVRPAERSLDAAISSLRKTVGDPPKPVPDTITTAENAKRRGELLKGGFDDAGEVYEFGQLRLEQQRLQMQKELQEGKKIDVDALIAIGQGEAYHEYMPLLLQSLQQTLDEYQALRAKAVEGKSDDERLIPSAALAKEQVVRNDVTAEMFIEFLNMALKERVEFGNGMLFVQAIRDKIKLDGSELSEIDKADYRRQFDALIASKKMKSDGSDILKAFMKAVETGNKDAPERKEAEGKALEHANKLNQRILDVLSGKTIATETFEIAFYPQALPLEVLLAAYERTLKRQQEIVHDPRDAKLKEELDALRAEGQGNANTLPKDKYERYNDLLGQQQNRKALLETLKTNRTTQIEMLLKHTANLGEFQIRAEELTAIQRQFGRTIDPKAGPSNTQGIPEEVKKGIDENMNERKNFHIDRIDAFLGTLEKEDGVLSIGAGERLEDFNNKNLRPIVLKVVEALSSVSLLAPKSFGIRERIRSTIAGDLEDAMGIPKNADGTPKDENEWTPDERAEVEKKAKSVMDAINEFRYETRKNERGETEFVRDENGRAIEKDHTKKLRGTITAIRALPPAKSYVGKQLGTLPAERVTPENIKQMLQDPNNGPAVYAKLMDQLLEDWGSVEDPPSGVIGESAEMMKKINGVVDVHLDVADTEMRLGADVLDISRYLIYALIAMGAINVAFGLRWLYKLQKKLFGKKPPTQAEMDQLRRELKTAVDENAGLKTENAGLKESGEFKPDDSLLTPDAEGSEHLDTTKIPPSQPDAGSIHKAATDVKGKGDATTDTDAKGGKKPGKGGRRG